MNFLKLACDDSKRVQDLRYVLFQHLVYLLRYPLRPVGMPPRYLTLLNKLRHVTEHMHDAYEVEAYKRRREE
jgi:hypothetical protein